MSTIKADVIENIAGGAATLTGHFTAKAWSVWNQVGTQSIQASGNISSITDSGTGDTTNNFSNSLSSSNFAAGFGAGQSSTDPYRYLGAYNTMTTSSIRTVTIHSSTAKYDAQYNAIQITL